MLPPQEAQERCAAFLLFVFCVQLAFYFVFLLVCVCVVVSFLNAHRFMIFAVPDDESPSSIARVPVFVIGTISDACVL